MATTSTKRSSRPAARSTKKRAGAAKTGRAPSRSAKSAGTAVPEISGSDADATVGILQERLVALIDLQLTLKHIHWNVTGPNFIAVHEMLDPQVTAVRAMTDEVAERIATCGGSPVGTPGAVAERRDWDEYDLGRDSTEAHLRKLDAVYRGVVEDHRRALEQLEELDPVSEDLITGHLGDLELFGWFVRSHLGT